MPCGQDWLEWPWFPGLSKYVLRGTCNRSELCTCIAMDKWKNKVLYTLDLDGEYAHEQSG